MRIFFNFINVKTNAQNFHMNRFNGISQHCWKQMTGQNEQRQQFYRPATHNEANAQIASFQPQRLLWPFSPNSNTTNETAPNLAYLQTDTKVLKGDISPGAKPQKEGRTSIFPRTTRVSSSPTYHAQFHRELCTIKLKVYGRSKINPLYGSEQSEYYFLSI